MSAVLRASRTPMIWAEALPRPARRHDEDDLQRQVLQFLHLALPVDAVVFAIPNGGLRSKREAGRLKGLGVRAGIPDLQVIWRGRAYFIELKAKNGRQSVEQRNMERVLHYCGAAVILCRTVEDCERMLREACVPLRASVL